MGEIAEELNGPTAVVSMVNGMIGGLILILPIMALNAGYIFSFLVIGLTGLFSFYSCYLCILHLGDQNDLDYAILRHFNGNKGIKIFYDICVWSNLFLIEMLYFNLIVIQWEGLILAEEIPVLNPIINVIILFVLAIVLKYFQFGASVMGYGIVSIIGYLLFLIWVLASSDQGYPQTPKAFGTGAVNMAAAMGGAFSIQAFFIPVLKKNKKPSKYVFYTMLAYLLGGAAYLYIAYMGSFGILHRFPPTGDISANEADTIEAYFIGGWEYLFSASVLCVSVVPADQQVTVMQIRKRFFGVFNIPESKGKFISVFEAIYMAVSIGVCLLITLLQVSITNIIDINGAVIGFFFIYFLPALLHLKCVYFSKGKRLFVRAPETQILTNLPQPRKESQMEMALPQNTSRFTGLNQSLIRNDTSIQPSNHIDGQDKLEQNLISLETQKQEAKSEPNEDIIKDQGVVNSADKGKQQMAVGDTLSLTQNEIDFSFYLCEVEKPSGVRQVLDLILIGVMVLLGAFIMVNGIYSVAISSYSN